VNRIITIKQLIALLGLGQVLRILLGKVRGAPTVRVRVPAVGHPVIARFNNSDLVLLLGIFLHKDCHLSLQPPPGTIIDLGANTGLTATAFHVQFPNLTLIAVEPDPEAFALCCLNTQSHPHTTCLQRIIGSQDGWGHLFNSEAISMARRYAIEDVGGNRGIPVTTVASLLHEFDCPPPILVKIDVEGAEIDLFSHAGDWLPNVQAVLVEPHGAGTDELIRKTLQQHRFRASQVGEKILGRQSPW
jgi:FkbM family methyltransferase